MKKNTTKKVIAGSMAFILTMGMTGFYGYQRSLNSVYAAEADVEQLQEVAEGALESHTEETGEIYKDESVYVKADASGAVKNTTVTEWLKNPGTGEIKDHSELKDIENIKGEETFVKENDSALSWNAEGKDIYYQGTTDKELPVEVKVSYKLNGKKVTPEEFSGKSGKAEICIEYINKSKESVSVSGQEEDMTVPFTMVTAMMLPTDEYKNVTVDHGKVVSDAEKDIVVGVGFPGLEENLNLDGLDIDLPKSVTITADVENASVESTVTVASADMLENFELENVDDFDSLENSIDELSNASEQLKDGSSQAEDGANQLAEGTKELSGGLHTLNDKSGELISGVDNLAAGAGSYARGVNEIAVSSAALAEGSGTLKEGIAAVQAGIGALKEGADQLVTGCTGVTGGLEGLSEALSGASQAVQNLGVNIQTGEIAGTASEAARASVVEALVENGVDEATANSYAERAAASVGTVVEDALGKAAGSASVTGADQAEAAVGTAQTALGQIQKGMEKLSGGASGLQEGLGTLYEKSDSLSAGAETLAGSMGQLASGAAKLNEKSNPLLAGITQLQEGGAQLLEGVGQLTEGSDAAMAGADALAEGNTALAEGMAEFKSSGIDKLTEVFKGDITRVTDRIHAMSDLGKSYKSFAGINGEMAGKTKFVIETEAIEK